MVSLKRTSKSDYKKKIIKNLATNIQQIRGLHQFLISWFLQIYHLNYFIINIFVLFKICMLSINRMELKKIIPQIKKKFFLSALVITNVKSHILLFSFISTTKMVKTRLYNH